MLRVAGGGGGGGPPPAPPPPPPPVRPCEPERADRQQQEQRFRVGGKQEEGRREQRRVKDRALRGLFSQFSSRERVEHQQGAEEGGVRHQQRSGQRPDARQPRHRPHRHRIQGEEGGARTLRRVPVGGQLQEPQSVLALGGREQRVPAGRGLGRRVAGVGGRLSGGYRHQSRSGDRDDEEQQSCSEERPERVAQAVADAGDAVRPSCLVHVATASVTGFRRHPRVPRARGRGSCLTHCASVQTRIAARTRTAISNTF